MKTFKFAHMTLTSDKGRYTLTADKGYKLRNTLTGQEADTTTTKDYTAWIAVEGKAEKTAKGKKATTK